MKIQPRRIILYLCKWLGLFHLTGFFYRKRLQILCYHGFSFRDEHEFAPGLFMRPEIFRQRMAWLARKGFSVLSLDEGVRRLRDRNLPDHGVVITADDGFRSIGELAVPVLESLNQPFTIYVTTYYMDKGTPIFRLAMQYMAWKAEDSAAELEALAAETLPPGWKSPKTGSEEPIWRLIDFAEAELSEDERVVLCRKAGDRLGIDYDDLSRAGLLSLMTGAEIRELAQRGVDIQLHTHRHVLPEEPKLMSREISENRARLEPLAGKKLEHFCYPSGIWSRAHWPDLDALGIKSATICDPGMVTSETPPLALNRFLDRDDVTQIEFEAELSGFKELTRDLRRLLFWRTAAASPIAGEYPD